MVDLKEQTEVSSTMTRAKIDTTPEQTVGKVPPMDSEHMVIVTLPLRDFSNGLVELTSLGLPEGAVVIDKRVNQFDRTVDLKVHHASLPFVACGELIPRWEIPQTWDRRVAMELHELHGKIEKLRQFRASDTFKTVSPRQQELLQQQLTCMQDYCRILAERLEEKNCG